MRDNSQSENKDSARGIWGMRLVWCSKLSSAEVNTVTPNFVNLPNRALRLQNSPAFMWYGFQLQILVAILDQNSRNMLFSPIYLAEKWRKWIVATHWLHFRSGNHHFIYAQNPSVSDRWQTEGPAVANPGFCPEGRGPQKWPVWPWKSLYLFPFSTFQSLLDF